MNLENKKASQTSMATPIKIPENEKIESRKGSVGRKVNAGTGAREDTTLSSREPLSPLIESKHKGLMANASGEYLIPPGAYIGGKDSAETIKRKRK